MEEKKVYVINANEINIEGLHVNGLSDEDFKAKAETEGSIYTLKDFEKAFNYERVSTRTDYIRIA